MLSSPLPSEEQGASAVAMSVGDDTRGAWSCPLPNEIFPVGSQGRDEEIAGVGVATALHRLLALGSTPARHASQPHRSRPSMPPAALALCAARLAGMAPCPLQRDGRAPHRARSTSCFVPIRRAGSRPAFAGADASVCHGASRSLPHVRRRDRDGVYFGQPTHDRTTLPLATHPLPLYTRGRGGRRRARAARAVAGYVAGARTRHSPCSAPRARRARGRPARLARCPGSRLASSVVRSSRWCTR